MFTVFIFWNLACDLLSFLYLCADGDFLFLKISTNISSISRLSSIYIHMLDFLTEFLVSIMLFCCCSVLVWIFSNWSVFCFVWSSAENYLLHFWFQIACFHFYSIHFILIVYWTSPCYQFFHHFSNFLNILLVIISFKSLTSDPLSGPPKSLILLSVFPLRYWSSGPIFLIINNFLYNYEYIKTVKVLIIDNIFSLQRC